MKNPTGTTLDHHWMPFTANRDFKANPRLQVKAEGMYYWNDRGEKILDGCSGLFCVAAGHGRPEIREAVLVFFTPAADQGGSRVIAKGSSGRRRLREAAPGNPSRTRDSVSSNPC